MDSKDTAVRRMRGLILVAFFAALFVYFAGQEGISVGTHFDIPNGWVDTWDVHAGAGAVTSKHVAVKSKKTGQYQVMNTILNIVANDGWTYTVKKNGGLDRSIEIVFEDAASCTIKFKYLVVPGKTFLQTGKAGSKCN